jgi:transcriptional regulator with XRE-family HTH domain
MTKLANNTRSFGELLRQARHDAGLTQSQLVRASGIPKPTLSRYENGHVMPSLGTLTRLCEALNIPEGSLLPGITSPEEHLYDALHDLDVKIESAEEAVRIAQIVAQLIKGESAVSEAL